MASKAKYTISDIQSLAGVLRGKLEKRAGMPLVSGIQCLSDTHPGDNDGNCSVWITRGYYFGGKCHSHGCDKADIERGFARLIGGQDSAADVIRYGAPNPVRAAEIEADESKRIIYARRLWDRASEVGEAIPIPLRLWLDTKEHHPIWADASIPENLRWIPDAPNALIGACARLNGVGEVRAVARVFIDAGGAPAKDKAGEGLGKRTNGAKTDAVCLLFRGVEPNFDTLHVCEGIADGLRILSIEGGDVAACIQTPNASLIPADSVIERGWARVVIWADMDDDGVGLRKARELRSHLADAGIAVELRAPPKGYDAASAPGSSEGIEYEIDTSSEADTASTSSMVAIDLDAPPKSATENNYIGSYELNPPGVMVSIIQTHARNLLAVFDSDSQTWSLLRDLGAGVWGAFGDRPKEYLHEIAKEIAGESIIQRERDKLTGDKTGANMYAFAKSLLRTSGQTDVFNQVGLAMEILEKRFGARSVHGLTYCDSSELDANPRYIGAPNGVIDTHTGKLLRGAAARRALVTRTIPDDYDENARTDDVDRLTAHLDDASARYIWDALGYALRGVPGERFYVLLGATGGGKTTLLEAVSAALGPYSGGRMGQNVYARARANKAGANPEIGMALTGGPRIAMVEELEKKSLDIAALKNDTGGGSITWRDLYETGKSAYQKNRRARTITGTLIWAMNPPIADFGLIDAAMRRRCRVLEYPQVPIGADAGSGYKARLQTDARNRQALVAKLVRYAAANPTLPTDIPSVEVATEEARVSAMGDAEIWAARHIIRTDRDSDRMHTSEVWSHVCEAAGGEDAWGMKRTPFTQMVGEVIGVKPKIIRAGAESKSGRGWIGIRMRNAAELADYDASQAQSVSDFEESAPIAIPEIIAEGIEEPTMVRPPAEGEIPHMRMITVSMAVEDLDNPDLHLQSRLEAGEAGLLDYIRAIQAEQSDGENLEVNAREFFGQFEDVKGLAESDGISIEDAIERAEAMNDAY